PFSLLHGGALLLRLDCFDPRDLAAGFTDTAGAFLLAGPALGPQVELFLAQIQQQRCQFIRRLGPHVADLVQYVLGHHASPTRAMNLVLIGSFAAPSVSASRASSGVTPSISNMIRPGATRATQNSGEPLPEPMRTSAGLVDTGTSGKMRIHTRPVRRMARVIARRADSICRAVMRSGSKAFRPK